MGPATGTSNMDTTKEDAMRTGYAFILGTITGAVVVGLWGRTLADCASDTTRGVRAKAAAGMRAVEDKTDEVFERGAKSFRHAEEVLEDTKEHVSEVLRGVRHAIRP